MRRLGFSTGALAKGDFRLGIELQRDQTDAIELSALRESELAALLAALPKLDLSRFRYVSLHAPSRRERLTERELVEQLEQAVPYIRAIIVHPDVIETPLRWKPIEEWIAIENMDQRKPAGRTVRELRMCFDALPQARFCFDIGHARQVDPTLAIGVGMLQMFADRLAEIHISEVNADSEHVAISSAAQKSFLRLSPLIPQAVPAIIESIVPPKAIKDEMQMAWASLGDLEQLQFPLQTASSTVGFSQ